MPALGPISPVPEPSATDRSLREGERWTLHFRSVTRRLQLRRSPLVRCSSHEFAPIHELSRANFMHSDEPMRTLLALY
jgi:hypothetical protein